MIQCCHSREPSLSCYLIHSWEGGIEETDSCISLRHYMQKQTQQPSLKFELDPPFSLSAFLLSIQSIFFKKDGAGDFYTYLIYTITRPIYNNERVS